MSGPALLVLDEPTVGLDGDAKAVLLAVVRDAARRGAAILMTTHDLEAAASLGDRVGFLARGRIVAEGPIPALLEQAFGPRSSVLLRRPSAAPASLAARLGACGLVFSEADGAWRSPGRGIGPEAVGRVMEAVAADAAGLQRLTVSRPGLGELYAAVAKGDFGR